MAHTPIVQLDVTPWGKSGQEPYPLLFHLLDTAAAGLALWDAYLTDNQRSVIAEGLGVSQAEARGLVAFWAGLHDLGKLTPGFQQCNDAAYERVSDALRTDVPSVDRMPHARASMQCSFGLLAAAGYTDENDRSPAARVAHVLGGHHGRFPEMNINHLADEAFSAGLGGASWAKLRGDYADIVHDVLERPQAPSKVSAPSAVLVTGLVILADWLVSQESFWAQQDARTPRLPADHFQWAMSTVPDTVASAGLARKTLARVPFRELHHIDEPNPLQESVMEELPQAVNGPGILLLTAATGDGKTEAGLEAERILAQASGTSGLCFVLPTMATSDEMHRRVARFVARQAPAGAPVTLTHSMAWLNSEYTDDQLEAGSSVLSEEDRGAGPHAVDGDYRLTRPCRWLRGPKRPLLAQYAVGTIDQALKAVLPVKHNALRLLALSGKTFIVDEAHAYDPYMQVLLGRLLNWLAAYRCPVVLLSATLPASIGDSLVKSYLSAIRGSAQALKNVRFKPPYPGWLFVDGSAAPRAVPSGDLQARQGELRKITLQIEVRPVQHTALPEPGQGLVDNARLAVIEETLRPLAVDKGYAAVVCNTVADAQDTYMHLKNRLGLQPGELILLHARLPGDQREETTRKIVSSLGRTGLPSSDRLVVVATQVIEQSLDLDVDLMISDLAPISQLLQRAGRCQRHETAWVKGGRPDRRRRPGWMQGTRLVVLDPVMGGRSVPRHWGGVYADYLLTATSARLAGLSGGRVEIPHDVQGIVEDVHGATSQFGNEVSAIDEQLMKHQAETMAQRHQGQFAAVPPVLRVRNLHQMHRDNLDEVAAVTRLGADSVRLLCCYRHADAGGLMTLDRCGKEPLPVPDAEGKFAVRDVRAVMQRTIPVRASWLVGHESEGEVPQAWREHPFLGDLMLLVHEVAGDGAVHVLWHGTGYLRLDSELGLVRTKFLEANTAPTSTT